MNYIIDEWSLRNLLAKEARYDALENGGVDNWEKYGTSIQDYLGLCKANAIYEIVNKRINEFGTLDRNIRRPRLY